MGIPVTRLWYIHPDGKRKLFNEISATSVFRFNISNLHLEEQRTKCAEILKRGWIEQGGLYEGSWKIEHGISEPVRFSKLTQQILEKFNVHS